MTKRGIYQWKWDGGAPNASPANQDHHHLQATSTRAPLCSLYVFPCPCLRSLLQPGTQYGHIMSYYDVDAILTDGEVTTIYPLLPTRLYTSPS